MASFTIAILFFLPISAQVFWPNRPERAFVTAAAVMALISIPAISAQTVTGMTQTSGWPAPLKMTIITVALALALWAQRIWLGHLLAPRAASALLWVWLGAFCLGFAAPTISTGHALAALAALAGRAFFRACGKGPASPPSRSKHWRNQLVVLGLTALTLPVLFDSLTRLNMVYTAGDQALPHIHQRYVDHPLLSLCHLSAGVLFLGLAPLQISAEVRRRAPKIHRWIGWSVVATGTVSGVAIMAMVIVFPALGGLLTQVVTLSLCSAMIGLFCLAIAARRNGNISLHADAMLLAYAIGLSVATARWLLLFAKILIGVSFEQAFVLASGLGVAVNLAVAGTLIVGRLWRRAP